MSDNLIVIAREFRLNYNLYCKSLRYTGVEDQRSQDLKKLDAELKQAGSSLEEKIKRGIIWRLNFPGMIIDFRYINLNLLTGSVVLDVVPIHPHRADLSFKGDMTLKRNVMPVTTNVIIQSADGLYLGGIRGGSVASGKIGVIPGGHAEYKPQSTDVKEHLLVEWEEELGYLPVKDRIFPTGLFLNRDTGGVNILYNSRSDLLFSDIERNWKSAKDRDEHQRIVGLSRRQIEDIAEFGETSIDEIRFSTTPFFQDCFINHLNLVK